MKNAFTVLGATPYDDIERLNELLEEKQLISDDDIEVQEAYTELTNPKKRIAQELIYFAGDLYSSFEAVASGTSKEKPTIGEAAHMLVDLGKSMRHAPQVVLPTLTSLFCCKLLKPFL